MPKFDYILVVSMAISLIWGIVFFACGCAIRFNLALFINNYVHGIDDLLNLKTCENSVATVCAIDTNVSNDVNIGQWTITLASLTIVCGFLTILFSVIGFVGGLKKNSALLILVILIDVAAMCTLYYLTHIISSYSAAWHQDAKEELTDLLRSDYRIKGVNDNLFTKVMNGFMLTGQCCGIEGPDDFKMMNLSFYDVDGKRLHKFMVPPTCCKRRMFSSGSMGFDSLLECASRLNNAYAWNAEGCYKTLYDYIVDRYGPTILALLLFLAVWLALQLVLAILTVLTPDAGPPPPPSLAPKPTSRTSDEIRRSLERKQIPKKFVPYSKISSFVSSDVNRIKSTEIW